MIRGDGFLIGPREVVFKSSWIEGLDDGELVEQVRSLSRLADDHDLIETHCGGIKDFDSIDEFYQYKQGLRVEQVSAHRKRELNQEARREFSANRRATALALIDRDGYVCAHRNCDNVADLTIGHVVPLSRGGGDYLGNLRFLCRPHNSAKGDALTRESPA